MDEVTSSHSQSLMDVSLDEVKEASSASSVPSVSAPALPMTTTWSIPANHELRLEVGEQPITVTMIKSPKTSAEVCGSQLAWGKVYQARAFSTLGIQSFHGCQLLLTGQPRHVYVDANVTSTVRLVNVNEAIYSAAPSSSAQHQIHLQPRVLIVGPSHKGRMTVCQTLANYAVNQGRQPLVVDLDLEHNMYSVPETVATQRWVKPSLADSMILSPLVKTSIAVQKQALSKPSDLAFLGCATPHSNPEAFRGLVQRESWHAEALCEKDPSLRTAGIYIRAPAWSPQQPGSYDALVTVATEFQANVIVVLESELLHQQLSNDERVKKTVQHVVSVPANGGIEPLSPALKQQREHDVIRQYFFQCHCRPVVIQVPLSDLAIHQFGSAASQLHDGMLPAGHRRTDSTRPALVSPSPLLNGALVAVAHVSDSKPLSLNSPMAGFVWIQSIDMARKLVTLCSPVPSLPSSVRFLVSQLRYPNPLSLVA